MTCIPPTPQLPLTTAPEAGLRVTMDSTVPGPPVARVSGVLDMATAVLLSLALHQAAGQRGELELNLSDLAFCDVVGLTAIEHACRQLADENCRVSLHGLEGLHALTEVLGLFDLPLRTVRTQPPAWPAGTP